MARDRLLGLPGKAVAADSTRVLVGHSIRSGENLLDAVFVEPASGRAKAGVLICHGIGETVRHWESAQRLLASEGVASLVFNYSGYGRSTGRIHALQFERDAMAAFHRLKQLLPSVPLSLLGFSLGSGIAAAIVTKLSVQRLILCAAFPSFREAAGRLMPKAIACLLPAIWRTEEALRSCCVPVLIIQGEADRLFPAHMARELARACGGPCELVLVPKLSHNAPIYQPQSSYWALIAARVTAS